MLVCHEPLDKEEQEFIIQWVEKHKETRLDDTGTITITIYWKDLIPEMEIEFGKFRSENKLKNFYYSRRKSRAGLIAAPIQPTTLSFELLESKPLPPKFK